MRGFPMPHPEEWAGVAQSKLASLQGWELVVVVEDSASDILDMDGVHLITFNQHNLPELEFEWGTSLRGYSMKNIGYLYAIKNGAKYIYDAEDSITLDEGAVKMFDYDKTTNGLWFYVNSKMNTSARIFNPYEFFGNKNATSGLVSRHFKNHTNARKRLRLCKERPSSVVQHGLVRGESRAISSDSGIETGADDEFNKFAPHINLAPGVFSAWDSANTLFHYGAFFALFVPVSVTSRSAMVIRSYYIQKLLHLTGASVGIHPPNSVMKRDEETRERLLDDGNLTVISNQMVEFLESWKCNQRRIETCMLALAKEFSDRHLWSEADLAAVSTWIKVLRRLSYKFPKITVENPDCAFVFEENTGGQNCRYVGIDFASSTSRNSAYTNLEIARQRIDAFKSVDEWCTVGGYGWNSRHIFPFYHRCPRRTERITESNCQYPTPSQLALMHRKDSVLTSNMDTVLVVINNHQRKTGMGLLQRLYQPYFGITIFCGTWNPYEYRDDGQYPEMISPFNYIHLSAAELVQGVFMHYCLAKVRELRLRNVRGGNAAKRAKKLFTEKYRDNEKVKELWSCYEKGLLEGGHFLDAASHVANDIGWTLSDFFYIPQKRLAYLAAALEIFYEARLFVELSMYKLLHTVPHNRLPREKFAYVPLQVRERWREYYHPNLVMIHPVKINTFTDKGKRKEFCETVIETYGKALFQCGQ
ncbi:hypothetical protein RB195_012383 [Necator americanus]|uniref:Uncharacterized protein n=1 Tax=Necator americanus TaxID=51031 RepID=A0ABR1D6V4_NECAM